MQLVMTLSLSDYSCHDVLPKHEIIHHVSVQRMANVFSSLPSEALYYVSRGRS